MAKLANLSASVVSAKTPGGVLAALRAAEAEISAQRSLGDRACARKSGQADGAYGDVYEQLAKVGLADRVCPSWGDYTERGAFASLLAVITSLDGLGKDSLDQAFPEASRSHGADLVNGSEPSVAPLGASILS